MFIELLNVHFNGGLTDIGLRNNPRLKTPCLSCLYQYTNKIL